MKKNGCGTLAVWLRHTWQNNLSDAATPPPTPGWPIHTIPHKSQKSNPKKSLQYFMITPIQNLYVDDVAGDGNRRQGSNWCLLMEIGSHNPWIQLSQMTNEKHGHGDEDDAAKNDKGGSGKIEYADDAKDGNWRWRLVIDAKLMEQESPPLVRKIIGTLKCSAPTRMMMKEGGY